MTTMKNTLAAWNKDHFDATFKQELESLSVDQLLLQNALRQGSHALDSNIKVMVLRREEQPESILVHAGIFFNSLVAGCNCADDPTPQDVNTEYCELSISIDKSDASSTIELV